MKRVRTYLWFSLFLALISGWVVGGMWKFQHALPPADWAATGVPLWERWLQKAKWFLEGFWPAALAGFLAGPIVFQLVPSEEWIAADRTGKRRRMVSITGTILLYLFAGLLAAHFVWVSWHAL